ncbi:MAG TPA: hypothetical protein VGJ84_00645, partial [Polyangiaceae bacterium]
MQRRPVQRRLLRTGAALLAFAETVRLLPVLPRLIDCPSLGHIGAQCNPRISSVEGLPAKMMMRVWRTPKLPFSKTATFTAFSQKG